MNKNLFTIRLAQAISDWQRGGSPKQKRRRGEALRKEANILPEKYLKTDNVCYRQIALNSQYLCYMGTAFKLSESLSSWTTKETVAKDFKGGIPPKGEYQGVIFAIIPPIGSVIVDLSKLFENNLFKEFVFNNKHQIDGYSEGIGRYQNIQKEVVIELNQVPLSSLYAWGGYSSSEDKLANMFFGHDPLEEELKLFKYWMKQSGGKTGSYWLNSKDAVKRVNERLKYHAKLFNKIS